MSSSNLTFSHLRRRPCTELDKPSANRAAHFATVCKSRER